MKKCFDCDFIRKKNFRKKSSLFENNKLKPQKLGLCLIFKLCSSDSNMATYVKSDPLNGEEVEILDKVTISPTFYAQLFRTKILHEAFLYLHFGFEHCRKYTTHKRLVKLTQGQRC